MSQSLTPQGLIYELTSVSEPSLSPDGTRLVFVRSKVDKEAMETSSQIMRMELPKGEVAPFTSGTKDGAPRFSPDGKSVAFLRPDSKERKQIWIIPTSAGEARKLTSAIAGVTELAWSPQSNALVFVSNVDPDQLPEDHDHKKDPRVRVVRRIRYRFDSVGWRGDGFRKLFVVDARSGEARQLTDGEGEDGAPAWSPDGTRIAFVSDRRDDRDIKGFVEAYVVPVAGGEPEQWSQGLSYAQYVTWSPDGKRLAVVGSNDDEVSDGRESALFILEPGQPPKRLTEAFLTVAIGSPMQWTDDDRIVFSASARGESYLYEIPASGGELRRIGDGGAQHTIAAFDSKGRTAVVLSVPPTSSGDLHSVDIKSGSQQQLTAYNHGYFEEHPTASLEKFTISRGGMEIQSRLWFPADFDSSKQYPLVVDVHGGPHGAFYDAFDQRQQVLASAGYIVLSVNPRGSSSYGPDFLKAVLRDWGGEDYLDIMAALDEVCSRPYVDASRLGIHGYSYGGVMSSWAVGHTTRFGAAGIGAPCINLASMYGTSDIGVRFGEMQWGGLRRDAVDAFREHSPLTYAANVETPVLLLHGEDDLRCPIEQSEQYFVALKRLDKEVEFVRFPGCSHMMFRNGHAQMREEYLSRMVAWFNDHIGAQVPSSSEARAVPADD